MGAVRGDSDVEAPVLDADRTPAPRRLVAVAREPDALDLDAGDVGRGEGGAEGRRRLDVDRSQTALEDGEQIALDTRPDGAAGEPEADRVTQAVGALVLDGTRSDQPGLGALVVDGGVVRPGLGNELGAGVR